MKSIPQMPFDKWNPVFTKKGQVFFLKCLHPVVFWLALDVGISHKQDEIAMVRGNFQTSLRDA